KGIVAITKDIQKVLLHPTAELFKEYLEAYIEIAITKDIWLVLFKVFPKVLKIKTNAGTKIAEWKKYPQISDAYKKCREYCLIPPIIAFALAVCCIILNPHSKNIRCIEEAVKKCCTIFL
ncbi:2965_t:CDS:2, partial [Funneliformis mosseae]